MFGIFWSSLAPLFALEGTRRIKNSTMFSAVTQQLAFEQRDALCLSHFEGSVQSFRPRPGANSGARFENTFQAGVKYLLGA